MNNKYIGFFWAAIAVGIVACVWFALPHDNKSATLAEPEKSNKPTQLSLKFSDVIASYPPNPKACLATEDSQKLGQDTSDSTNLMYAVIGTIIDIPAGTNVDVYIKTQGKTRVTGTSIYESTYGTYNFTAQKIKSGTVSEQGSWMVTDFVACKK